MKNEKNQNSADSYFEPPNILEDEKIDDFTAGSTRNQIYDDVVIGFFSFQGRTGRLEYFKIESMIALFLLINFFYFVPRANEEYVTGFLITAWLITLLTFPITVRRLHDSNLSGWFYLINLIPNVLLRSNNLIFSFISAGFGIYFLYLILREGNLNPNDYGIPDPPKKYGNTTINLICVLLFIMIVISGILASI